MAGASSKRSAHRGARWGGLVAAAAASLAGAGCGDGGGYPGTQGGTGGHLIITGGNGSTGSGKISPTSLVEGQCPTDGETRSCHVLVGKHADVVNCYNGVQLCDQGVWTGCIDGAYSSKKQHHGAGLGQREGAELSDEASLVTPEVGAASTPALAGGDLGEDPLNAPVAGCKDDPCDPTCFTFKEVPVAGMGMASMSMFSTWVGTTTSTLGNAKASLAGKGWTTPCDMSYDCQNSLACGSPVTKAACSHNKCAVGPAMDPACADPCVTAVCAVNPNCCIPVTLPHSPCVISNGVPMTSCGTDIHCTHVCAAGPTKHCCMAGDPMGWSVDCVTAYGVDVGAACPSDPNRAWDSSTTPGDVAVGSMACTNLVHDICGLQCPSTLPAGATCDHDVCSTGSALAPGCDGAVGCVANVCLAMPSCCVAGAVAPWTQACINAVPAACQTACVAPAGACAIVQPNQVDAQCPGPDLTMGPPCVATAANALISNVTAGTSYVTVCNHGTQPTPANATIVIKRYQAGTANVQGYPPAGTSAGADCTINTATLPGNAILTGKCVDVPCAPAWHEQLFVNPPGVGQIVECGNAAQNNGAYTNNWGTDIQGGTAISPVPVNCDAPQCSTVSGTVRGLGSHLVMVVENSSAMPSAPIEWNGIVAGLSNFFSANANAQTLNGQANSLNAATLGIFPDPLGLNNCTVVGGLNNCAVGALAGCVNSLNMKPFAGGVAALAAGLTYGLVPQDSTRPPPYITALQGAYNAAAADLLLKTAASGWTESVVLILGSDMTAQLAVNDCTSTPAAMGGMAALALLNSKIRTFVIAVGPAQIATAQTIANAGGGKAYYVANDASIATNLGAALADIESYADQACSFALPPIALFDMAATTVSLSAPSGPTTPDATHIGYNFPAITTINQVVPTAGQITTAGGNYLAACLLQACPGNGANPNLLGHGWCFNDPVAPTSITLCPTSCLAMGTDEWAANTGGVMAHATATYTPACPSFFNSGSYGLSPYQADCNLDGTKPLWSWLAYDTADPAGTSVSFSFQTADKDPATGACPPAAMFGAASPFTVTASMGSTTGQVCSWAAGTTTCPVDLVQGINGFNTMKNCTTDPARPGYFNCSLNGPAQADCMNLTVALNPNLAHTYTPTVNSFDLRYSCPFTE